MWLQQNKQILKHYVFLISIWYMEEYYTPNSMRQTNLFFKLTIVTFQDQSTGDFLDDTLSLSLSVPSTFKGTARKISQH